MSARAPKKLDFYAWHPFAYRADTTHLTREENFAYRAILDEIFVTAQDSCRIPDDDEYLRRVAKATTEEWKSIRRTLIDGPRALLAKRGKWISSPRLTVEIRRAHEKSSTARKAVDERERKKRSTDDDRTMIERSSTKREKNPTGSKKEIKGLTNVNPSAAAIRAALKDAKIPVTKAAEKLIERWAESPGPERVAELLNTNLDAVQAADRPLSYFRAIVTSNSTAPAKPVAAVMSLDPEPRSREEIIRDLSDEIGNWITINGDPDDEPQSLENFNAGGGFLSRIVPDREGENRWEKWKRVCLEIGIEPKRRAA